MILGVNPSPIHFISEIKEYSGRVLPSSFICVKIMSREFSSSLTLRNASKTTIFVVGVCGSTGMPFWTRAKIFFAWRSWSTRYACFCDHLQKSRTKRAYSIESMCWKCTYFFTNSVSLEPRSSLMIEVIPGITWSSKFPKFSFALINRLITLWYCLDNRSNSQ